MPDARKMPASLLGVSSQDAHDELGLIRETSVRLEWLRSKFFNITDANSERHIQCATRAYLMYLWATFVTFQHILLELKNMYMNLRAELWRDPLIESTG